MVIGFNGFHRNRKLCSCVDVHSTAPRHVQPIAEEPRRHSHCSHLLGVAEILQSMRTFGSSLSLLPSSSWSSSLFSLSSSPLKPSSSSSSFSSPWTKPSSPQCTGEVEFTLDFYLISILNSYFNSGHVWPTSPGFVEKLIYSWVTLNRRKYSGMRWYRDFWW